MIYFFKKLFWRANGQTLVEVLFGLALFLLAVSGAMILASRYLETLQKSSDIEEATFLAEEGFEAIKSISYESWNLLTDQAHGLTKTSGVWNVQTIPDSVDGYNRTIQISSVYRDQTCAISPSPGTLDPDTKQVEITIDWTRDSQSFSETFSKYVTNWKNAGELCSVTQAGSLVIHVDDEVTKACFDKSTHKELHDVIFENSGLTPITVAELIVSWVDDDGESDGEILRISIYNLNYWQASSGKPSGSLLALYPDLILDPGESVSIDRFRFDTKIDEYYFTITAIMGDASQTEVTTDEFLPKC